jgi:predicted AAA+ superfamily ATPase
MTALENITEIVSSYLFKDILEFQHLKKPDVLLELLKLLAFQISNEVSYTELARKLRVDQTVVQRYIQLLEDSFIIFRLKALKKNLRNEIGKSRKIYFWDLGVRNALIQNTNSLDFRNDQGALWENFCVAEREKTMDYNIPRIVNTYFWRNYNQKEIDLIEERGEKYIAYEFKWSTVKKFKPPADFIKGYPGSEFRVVTPENFVSEIYS